MKKYLIIGAVLSLWAVFSVYSCLSQTKEKTILNNVLTFELSLGDKNLPSEYLLAVPYAFVIANNNDVIVFDESKLKIYDAKGKPKQIVGGPGQGPGEFLKYAEPFYSEDGYLTVINIATPFPSYNLFGPDYKFIEQKNIETSEVYKKFQNNFKPDRISFLKIYTFSGKKQIIMLQRFYQSSATSGTADSLYFDIVFVTENDSKIIHSAKRRSNPNDFSVFVPEAGDLEYDFLSNHRIAYTNSKIHKTVDNDIWYYIIYLHNFDTGKSQEIKHPYTRLALPDSLRNWEINKNLPKALFEMQEGMLNVYKKLEHYAPVARLIGDGNYLFVFSFLKKNGHYAADVFEVNQNKYICSAYLPYGIIKNGYFYRKVKNNEGYYVIEKYRIDPKVYGK